MTKYTQNIKSMERYEEKLKELGHRRVNIRFKKDVIESLEKFQKDNGFKNLNDTIDFLLPKKD